MRLSGFAIFAAAQTAWAQHQALLPRAGNENFPRDFGDGICVLGSTCDDCYGDGYIICDKIGCFNPDEHQQCCKDAVYCVSESDDCCDDWGGTGVIGSSGAPIAPPTSTPTAQPTESGTGWTCTGDEDPEECCQKGGDDTHYCGGEFPNSLCLNITNQWCCSDGTVCEDKNCCQKLFDLSTTQPWLAQATTESGATVTVTSPPNETDAASDSSPETSTSTDGASMFMGDAGLGWLIGPVLGVALWL